jgi:hypothetical protein
MQFPCWFPAEYGLDHSESHPIIHLSQPFTAFLLAPQWGGEYKRIASDHDIIAQVRNMSSVRDMMVCALTFLLLIYTHLIVFALHVS